MMLMTTTTTTLLVVMMMMPVAVAQGAGAQGAVAQGAGAQGQQPTGNLMEEIQKAGANTAYSVLKAHGVEAMLSTGYFTLFVPTDAAFQQLPQEWKIHLNVNASARDRLLQYHVVPAIFRTQDAFDNMLLNTTLGELVRVNVYSDNAQTTQVTTVEGARIVQGDIAATNGYLHLVDRVLLPPDGNFYDLLLASPELSTFRNLVDQAGLMTQLSDHEGTLLAPSNNAFTPFISSLGQTNYNSLLQNHESIRELVLYHMLDRVLFSAGAFSGSYTSKDMANMVNITITPGSGGVMQVQNATVTQSDVAATNGVMQVLDTVLCPPTLPIPLVGK